MDDQKKEHIDPKRSPQRNLLKQLRTQNLPNGANKNQSYQSKNR